MRLNLGAGESPIAGYDNSWDIGCGKKAFPLEVDDASCDEIRASHILEHFGHRVTEKILQHWVSKLKPGGLIKIAVPDLEVIAQKFLNGEAGQFQGWIFGGQVDQNDVHGAGFSFDSLSAMMRRAGLVGIHLWPGDMDCSGLEVSLNLAAYKPPEAWPVTRAAMTIPRLGWQDNFGSIGEALMPLGIPLYARTGAYWGRTFMTAIDQCLKEGCEYVLAVDYDSLFGLDEVQDLLAFMAAKPDADALIGFQQHRNEPRVLFNFKPEPGQTKLSLADMDATYLPVRSAHFGLSLFRAEALKKLPRPWFVETFDEDGEYKTDADVNFWIKFAEAGLNAFACPRVVIGHLEVMALWPDQRLKHIHQNVTKYNLEGKPRGVWR